MGFGYLAGVIIVTLILKALAELGVGFNFAAAASLLSVFGLLGLLSSWLVVTPAPPALHRQPQSPPSGWTYFVFAVAGLLLLRYWGIAQEISIRPLFAWDAWMNWAPKAIVWFEAGAMHEFVSPEEWLLQGYTSTAYTLGNAAANRYPETVPLIQYWGMLALGDSRSPVIYFPWLLIIVSLGCALYGLMLLSGSDRLMAALACYVLLNLPYINVHTALVGYADIWLACAVCLSSFCLHNWWKFKSTGYLFLTVFFSVSCMLLKVPGLIIGALILFVLFCYLLSGYRQAFFSLLALIAIILILTLTTGLTFDIPGTGQVVLNSNTISLPYIGSFDIEYHPVFTEILTATFLSRNWNILFYIFALAVICDLKRPLKCVKYSPLLPLIISILIFIIFISAFTEHYVSVVNFTTINRALLYAIPTIIYYIFIQARKLNSQAQSPMGNHGS